MNKNFLLLAVVYGMSGCAINTYFANIGGVLEALSIPYVGNIYIYIYILGNSILHGNQFSPSGDCGQFGDVLLCRKNSRI